MGRMFEGTSGAGAATTLVNARSIARGFGPWPVETAEQAIAWEDGRITYVGPADELTGAEPEWFEDCTIAPGFVDCHTHLPFAGWRADEFEARLSGVSYRELHGGGGICRRGRMVAEAYDDEVLGIWRAVGWGIDGTGAAT